MRKATLGGKWLELLSEIAPGLKRVAIMLNPDTAPVLADVVGDCCRRHGSRFGLISSGPRRKVYASVFSGI
jgi:hypothetical protein